MHFVLNVDSDGVDCFVDGVRVRRDYGFPVSRRGNYDEPCEPRTIQNGLCAGGAALSGAGSAAAIATVATGTQTIAGIVTASADHTTLLGAVNTAGLAATLDGPGNFTLFAPTNAAFAALPEGTLQALYDDISKLTAILTYHALGGVAVASDLSDGLQTTTLQGTDIMVTITADGTFINGAQVTVVDQPATNGVVHIIDAVLLPPDCSYGDRITAPIYLGGPPGGSGGRSFSGSIMGLALMRTTLSDTQVDCLFRGTESDVHICPAPEDMPGVHHAVTMEPATWMMTGAYTTDLPELGTDGALAACATYCRSQDFMYMGLQWANMCFCDNEYGKYGSVPSHACDVDDDGTMDCGQWGGDSGDIPANASAPGREAMMVCTWKAAVYSIGSEAAPELTELGCFREGAMMPAGMALGGNAYFDNGGPSTGIYGAGPGIADDEVIGGSSDTTDNFGIHFDGRGDYATISGVDAGYASDGTFAISLWATRPSCRLSGRPETIFSHTANPDDWSSSSIFIAYVCGSQSTTQHSTAQKFNTTGDETYESTDLIRVRMVDTDGVTAMFDVPMADAASGGYVDDSWLHLMLSVDRMDGSRDRSAPRAVSFFVDGRKIRPWHFGYPAYIPHALDGPAMRLSGNDVSSCAATDVASEAEATACGAVTALDDATACAAATNCAYTAATTAAEYMEMCSSSCDETLGFFAMEGGGPRSICRCGNVDMVSLVAINATMCDADGDGEPNCGLGALGSCPSGPGMASLPMALFEKLSDSVAAALGRPQQFVGCFMDGGSNNMGGRNYQDVANNAAYDPNRRTRLSNVTIGTFNMDTVYENNNRVNGTDYFIPVPVNPNNTFSFHAMAVNCWGSQDDCWNGARWEVWNPARDTKLAEMLTPGMVGTDVWTDVVVPQDLDTVHVRIHIQSTRGESNIKWELEDMTTSAIVAAGPPASTIYLGGHAPRSRGPGRGTASGNFVGNIANVVVFDRVPDDDEVDCMYRSQGAKIGSCRAPDKMWATSFWESFVGDDVDSWRTTNGERDGMLLLGGATLHDHMGLDLTSNADRRPMGNGTYYSMDGQGEADYITGLTDASAQMATLDGCAAQCASDGYQYMGLTWGQECMCDNVYDGMGVADATEARNESCYSTDGSGSSINLPGSTCDVATAAMSIDAATGAVNSTSCSAAGCYYDGPGTAYWATNVASDGCDRPCNGDNTTMCGGGLGASVYDVSTYQADEAAAAGSGYMGSGYQGCYKDHWGAWAQLDGQDDYAMDATFSVSFWFTKRSCDHTDVTGEREPLYIHGGEWCNTTTHPDSCTDAKIHIYLLCNGNSTAAEGIQQNLHTVIVDDDGNWASIDTPLADAQSGGELTDAWVHYAITVDRDRITPYIDGQEETNVGNFHSWGADTPENLAYVNRSVDVDVFNPRESGVALSAPLGTMNFTKPSGETSQVVLGRDSDHHKARLFNGYMAGVGVYRRAIDATEINCLFKYGETHLSIPDGYEPPAPVRAGGGGRGL